MKQIALVLVLASTVAYAQKDKQPPPAPVKTEAPAPAVVKPDVVTPKESVDSLKLDLALERQMKIRSDASALQQKALQSVEPQLGPMRTEFSEQTRVATEEADKVRKENGFGPEVQLDQNLDSPTFGKWVRAPKK